MLKIIPLLLTVVLSTIGCSKTSDTSGIMALPSMGRFSSSDMATSPYIGQPPSVDWHELSAFSHAATVNPTSSVQDAGTVEPEAFFENNTIERKLVRRATISMRVEYLDAASSSLEDLMVIFGAYSASTTIDVNSHRYTIRIPSQVYRAFLAEMNGMGTILNRSESAVDVTIRYFDLEGRLSTQQELLRTFQSYLGRAENIEEILSVERRIAELQSEIDRTGGELRTLLDSVIYSTIDLTINGPVALSMPNQGPTLADRFARRYKAFFNNFGNFFSALVFVLIGIVIYGIPLLLLSVFFFWVLFGKLGLLKKLWRAASDRKQKTATNKG